MPKKIRSQFSEVPWAIETDSDEPDESNAKDMILSPVEKSTKKNNKENKIEVAVDGIYQHLPMGVEDVKGLFKE